MRQEGPVYFARQIGAPTYLLTLTLTCHWHLYIYIVAFVLSYFRYNKATVSSFVCVLFLSRLLVIRTSLYSSGFYLPFVACSISGSSSSIIRCRSVLCRQVTSAILTLRSSAPDQLTRKVGTHSAGQSLSLVVPLLEHLADIIWLRVRSLKSEGRIRTSTPTAASLLNILLNQFLYPFEELFYAIQMGPRGDLGGGMQIGVIVPPQS